LTIITHSADCFEPWTALHNTIEPITVKVNESNKLSAISNNSIGKLEGSYHDHYATKISTGIHKNSILNEYQESCTTKGFTLNATTTLIGDKLMKIPTSIPTQNQLLQYCSMKPRSNHYY
jgi:hypothetical protein